MKKQLDRSFIGRKYDPVIFNVTEERIKLFAEATGQTDPIYYDLNYAKREGYSSLLAPPTFLTTVAYEQEDPYKYIRDLNINMGQFLHANQEYSYFLKVYGGDTIKMYQEIGDIFDKKDGQLQFIVFKSTYLNQNEKIVAKAKSTLVVR